MRDDAPLDPWRPGVTATEIGYLKLCPRKLWLFRHGVRLEKENVAVQLGRLLQEESFTREEHEVALGESGVVDWIDLEEGIVHETKRGHAPEHANEAQVIFYLWWLRETGVAVNKAIIHFPEKKRKTTMDWRDDMKQAIEDDIRAVKALISSPSPPPVKRLGYCKHCAYFDFCFSL